MELQLIWRNFQRWASRNLLAKKILLQLGIIAGFLILSGILTYYINAYITKQLKHPFRYAWLKKLLARSRSLVFPAIGLLFFGTYSIAIGGTRFPQHLTDAITILLGAWFIINVISLFLKPGYFFKISKVIVIIIAALHIFEIYDDTIKFLSDISFSLGNIKLNIYSLIKGVLVFMLFLWVAHAISKAFEHRIAKLDDINSSMKVLFSKISKIILFIIAVIISLNVIGLNLTTLNVLGGALGLGLGFGLQKVVSNFVSGIILLADNSIKPGDVIAVNDTYGWVNTLGARYVSLITRDGKEHLIPNESLITQQVENWSFTDNKVRIKIPIGIAYDSDVKLAMKLMERAAKESPRILNTPEPQARMRGFGDNAIQLDLRFWIADPANGMANVKSDVLLRIWENFKEHEIGVPFPQRDVYIHSGEKDK